MEGYQKQLKEKMNKLARDIYRATRSFPREEIYGITSQVRRAGLSIILNYIEGCTRETNKARLNFLRISYGSLREVKYLLYFSCNENYISKDQYQIMINLSEEIGAMLWTEVDNLSKSC